MRTELTVDRLRSLLHYDPATGVFTNLVKRGSAQLGRKVGSATSKGYLRAMVDGRSYRCHRLAWLYVTGEWPSDQIDHINGVRTDNRFVNLRDVGPRENRENAHAAHGRVPLMGVGVDGRRFNASIRVSGKSVFLGLFDTPEQAHAAYLEAKRALHPAFIG